MLLKTNKIKIINYYIQINNNKTMGNCYDRETSNTFADHKEIKIKFFMENNHEYTAKTKGGRVVCNIWGP